MALLSFVESAPRAYRLKVGNADPLRISTEPGTSPLTAPTSGKTQGIVMYGDRKMPQGTTFSLTGGGTQNFGGAIYLPKTNLSFSGGSGTTTSCTKVIADTLNFTGTSALQVNCNALGTAAIGSSTAQLVE